VVELPLERTTRLARRLAVQSAPTVLVLDGQGRVLRRFTGPPDRRELERAVAGGPYDAAAAGSTSKLRA
jgi:hypothetical protein